MSKSKTEYEKLRDEWYDKLKDEGFEDIESSEDRLKMWSTRAMRKNANENLLDSWQAKAAYYYMADSFLAEHEFDSSLERIIWEYHANALSHADIAEILNSAKIAKTNRTTVGLTIKRLVELMKKKYMNS